MPGTSTWIDRPQGSGVAPAGGSGRPGGRLRSRPPGARGTTRCAVSAADTGCASRSSHRWSASQQSWSGSPAPFV